MRWLLVASLLLSVGCRQIFGIGDPGLAGDATIDVVDVLQDSVSANCFGAPMQICVPQLPTSPFTFTSTNINTDSAACVPFTSPQGIPGCLFAGTSVTLTGTIHITGSRPLIVLSTSSMTMSTGAMLDAASHRGAAPGPGANAASCTSGTPPTTASGTSGGGAGGSFGGKGGGGGSGAQGGNGGNAGATVAVPMGLRGGCAGQNGAGLIGASGDGGGAILLVALTTIQVDGSINVSGGGADGGAPSAGGGGGGGSGGLLVVEAAMLTVSNNGTVFASGGGGGEGSGTGSTGNPGGEANGPGAPGGGGNGANPNSGDGGDGSFGSTLAGGKGGNALSTANGGGGGGGAGYLLVHAPSQSIASANVAPPVTVLP